MIVAFENNVICSDEKVRDYLLARHADLKKMQDEKHVLYLARLHKEEGIHGTDQVDLTGWRETSRELYWADGQMEYNYSIIHFSRVANPLQMSVVLSTCNQPAWLEKVLWGYEAQDTKDFELIVADDGSRKETYDMLQRVVPQLSYHVKHVWHEDKGFRKCNILNKGILAAQTDYLLFSDGDCIPRKDFVSTHLHLRHKGRFLSGGYHKLSMDLSNDITKEDILSGRCFDLQWLKAKGMPSSFKNNKLTATGFKRWALNTFTPTKASWNGHNASGWLCDILAVNGFDERMQYGGQDREFGERLENYGIHGMQIRYSTVCLHLDHARGYKTQDSIQKNRNIRKHTRGEKVQWSPYGIVKDELSSVSVMANSCYDGYTREDEKLAYYKEQGGFYRHLYSLPCRWRKTHYQNKVVSAIADITNLPVLSNQSGLIVSLTTFPARIGQLHLVLKSILLQTYKPERIVVWLTEEEFPNRWDNLPPELIALQSNGVELRFVSTNLRSHNKYYYVFRDFPDKQVVTIDDDLIYSRDTIERLILMSYKYPNTVCSNVIRKIEINEGHFAVYKKWKKVSEGELTSSLLNMAAGYGGTLYPPRWYGDLLFDKAIIREKCMTADDLWLKANEIVQQIKVTGGGAFFSHPVTLSHTQRDSLQKSNNGRINLNDKQWHSLNNILKLNELILIE